MDFEASQQNLHKVFVYGTLLDDTVVRILLKRIPQSFCATLPNYHRFNIKGQTYPAILPRNDMRVNGRILVDVTDSELHILDEFEDVQYIRCNVEASLMESSEKLEVNAYVWAREMDPDLHGEWDFEVWQKLHKAEFVKTVSHFVQQLNLPDQSNT